ncbi:hypothetical protein [Piscinibacterium candidicorallinum]|uniref:Secreted protein n=1 Tax=Piscinibacterium candidicorallinum TaxID=1793872 RepID=A0ABV7H2R1_9BURK
MHFKRTPLVIFALGLTLGSIGAVQAQTTTTTPQRGSLSSFTINPAAIKQLVIDWSSVIVVSASSIQPFSFGSSSSSGSASSSSSSSSSYASASSYSGPNGVFTSATTSGNATATATATNGTTSSCTRSVNGVTTSC